MRSVVKESARKAVRSTTKKSASAKRKKVADMKSPVRDTISETISFVIKGKLTPIKPILIENKLDLITKPQKCGKVIKKRACKMSQNCQIIKKHQETNTKVQSKTAKKPSAQNIKKSDKIMTEVIPSTPKEKAKKVTRCESKRVALKAQKKPLVQKSEICDVKKKIKKTPKKCKESTSEIKTKISASEIKNKEPRAVVENRNDDDIKKQQTIEKLLKQANKELKPNNTKAKLKKIKVKERADIKKVRKPPKAEKVKGKLKNSAKSESDTSANCTSDDISLKELSQRPLDIDSCKIQPIKIKTEPVSDVSHKITPKRKIKTKPKITIIKKRVMASKSKLSNKDEKRKTKLFGFWNGPKRHRVASLNALAKVHCLYENETRGNILDIIDESNAKREYTPKKESVKKDATKTVVKKEPVLKKEIDEESEENSNPASPVPAPTRTLRSMPGLRAVGKHWEMHETSSSSEDSNSSNDSYTETIPIKAIKKEKASQQKQEKDDESEDSKKETKRRRNRSEVVMDLKDMVVRKRMASLNATAILAASYSVEKRPTRSQKDVGEDSSSYDSGSSEEYFAASDNDIKEEDDKKEEDTKLIEVHTTPNKKVAVILNQDTDVTITGVYVNSTTRSTHHEGYCSIAGMQYRISATSHTQTAATAVATETLLQSSSSSAPENSNSDSLPSSSKSYTPLDALSNMQPPPGPGIQHNHPVIHSQPHMGPPQHVLPMPPHQLSPGLRHGCSSAFSSPHSTSSYQLPPGHPPMQGESGYVHGSRCTNWRGRPPGRRR